MTGTQGFAMLRGGDADATAAAAEAERLGYHTVWSPEFDTRSAVVSLAAMPYATSGVRLGGSIAYAVGRTPSPVSVTLTRSQYYQPCCTGRKITGWLI
jgi:alkanesulfonate monooxygenase SsuD/methylene tetrahydromethanopterin reductase-like flavin-dependent oxidoreductase (luciferase family)